MRLDLTMVSGLVAATPHSFDIPEYDIGYSVGQHVLKRKHRRDGGAT